MFRAMLFHRRDGTFTEDVPPEKWPALLADENFLLLVEAENPTREELARLEEVFRLHPLEVDTIARRQKRPKVRQYPDHLHLVLHSPLLERQEHRLRAPELDIIMGRNFMVVCRWSAIPSLESLLQRVRRSPEEILGQGTDGLLYLLIDELVENYQPVLDRISGLLAGLEDRIIRRPTTALLTELSGIKRQLLALRRVAIPQAETILLLSREEVPLIDPARRVYFRDLCDRLNRVADIVETYRDLVTGARDTYLSVVSNRMNEVMQTLTIIATIMMPLTLIAGIYGMNFVNMPELKWRYGYFVVMGVMAVIAAGMVYLFRRKRWL